MKKLIVILCAVVAVFGLTSCKSSSPSDTVKAYYKALQAGDYEKALSYTDITDQEVIQKQIEKCKELDFKVVDFEILSENVSEDRNSATVEVKTSVTFEGETDEGTQKLKLVKVDGKWKIHA